MLKDVKTVVENVEVVVSSPSSKQATAYDVETLEIVGEVRFSW